MRYTTRLDALLATAAFTKREWRLPKPSLLLGVTGDASPAGAQPFYTAIGCHSFGMYTVILLLLLSFAVEMAANIAPG